MFPCCMFLVQQEAQFHEGSPRQRLLDQVFRRSPPQFPATQDAKTWSISLDYLLNSEHGKNLFKTFLQEEFLKLQKEKPYLSHNYNPKVNIHQLEFYDAVDEYKNSSEKKLRKKAKEIVNTFLLYLAPKRVNLDFLTRTDLINYADVSMEVSRHIFDFAQQKVFKMIKDGSYIRFLKWDKYTSLVEPQFKNYTN